MITPSSPTDLEAVKLVDVADVYKGTRLAASLSRTDEGIRFTYFEDYLRDAGPAVASTLPLTDEPLMTTAGAVPPFFAGLLPEGRRLNNLQRAVKTSADDDFSLLVAVGADTVGDVRVVPHGVDPIDVPPLVQVDKDFSEVTFADVLEAGGVVDRTSLAGVQDKASAGMISLPVTQAGKRFVLKVDPPEYPHVVEDEAYYIELAHRAKFPVVTAQVVHDATSRSGLLVERFDRVATVDGQTQSRAVEDSAQALGLYPADKYNVSAEIAISRLGDLCPARPVALRDLYRQVCFAWLTGNGDLHAKNMSVVDVDGEWRVAPAYDIPSTLPYGDRTLALRVGSKNSGLSRRLLIEFAVRLELNERIATRVLDEVLAATEPIDSDWADGSSPFNPSVTRDVLRQLRTRRRLAR